ncbi:MAG: Protein translocase subunit SecD [Chlamydiia bacterium]|nr:Protein translocase subunit SecD [Chlamydiia bacterium]
MEKNKSWQTLVIIAAIVLTVYNILPTVLYYTKPLGHPITKQQAHAIAEDASQRVNALEDQSVAWLKSYLSLLNIKSGTVSADGKNPQAINIQFSSNADSKKFQNYFPRAGQLIPFFPAQLSLLPSEDNWKTVQVLRKIPLQLDQQAIDEGFAYVQKFDENHSPTEAYQDIVYDRLLQVGISAGGVSENAQLLGLALQAPNSARSSEFFYALAQNIETYADVFGESSPIAGRYFGTVTQGYFAKKSTAVTDLLSGLNGLKDQVLSEKVKLQEGLETSEDRAAIEQKIAFLQAKEDKLVKVAAVVKRNSAKFAGGPNPWTFEGLKARKNASHSQLVSKSVSPIIDSITTNWTDQTLVLRLTPDVLMVKNTLEKDPTKSLMRDRLNQLIIDEIARISRESRETIVPIRDEYKIELSSLSDSSSVLTFDLATVAKSAQAQVEGFLSTKWTPSMAELQAENYPVVSYAKHQAMPSIQKNLSLVVYSPVLEAKTPVQGFKTNSIYVIAKGLGKIYNRYLNDPHSENGEKFQTDFNQLRALLQSHGFIGYPGTTFPLSKEFADDFIFEAEDFYMPVLQATREQFQVHGTQHFATLELSTLKQRIAAVNKIENQVQEDLIKWRDEYQTAQVDPTGKTAFDVPKPTRSPLWENMALSVKKYFRGDERKILQWGLDLSGGKTVQIQLKNTNGQVVSSEADIKQAINELYTRVNKMGVSDVNIRQEGNNISLDFPGSQDLSASELIRASSMTFHIVNEKFSVQNSTYADTVNRFCQEVWNEALVTGKKDAESINQIAWTHLNGDSLDGETVQPRSEAAKMLFDAGLRLADPRNPGASHLFDDSVSKLAIYRGDSFSDWYGQTNPLLIVFNNYALEGTNLDSVHAGYDPAKGNYLSFGVKSSAVSSSGEKSNPSKNLFAWTSVFSKERVLGTPYEVITSGRGWRMAVILNGQVVSAPALESALRDSAMITGNFSQREVNHLVSDLKAGSLSFVPQILSEKNVSPELGISERQQGIMATAVALVLVILAMVSYYRFAGVVASVAVIFNLFIIWATLQNIQASITLAGIAGIILTVGMAVDANVLVFERIREECAHSKRIGTAISIGYKKAFSAIIDSNITTIIAALVLLNFDSGPIKGFAVTLIIGIASSMFSALFMTRYFFARWVQNPKHKNLKMANLIKAKNFDFFKLTKPGFIVSGVILALGCIFMYSARHTILGMDFTGGFAINVEVEKGSTANYRLQVEEALTKAGLAKSEFQVRELSPSNSLRIFLSNSLTHTGKPLADLGLQTDRTDVTYPFENYPKLVWLSNALVKGDVKLSEQSLKFLDKNFNSVSGQMSDTMRNNAFIGLGIALLCILVYITIRFEFKYAISATLGLGYDLLITLSLVAILNRLGVPVQIDLNTVAALMTIIGYSLNDTIIVFDRIREVVKLMKHRPFKEIINLAINTTLSRTILTSGTTLLVLIALVVLGGATIFGFALVMLLGVVVGTISSCFISTSLLYFFGKYEESRTQGSLLNGT